MSEPPKPAGKPSVPAERNPVGRASVPADAEPKQSNPTDPARGFRAARRRLPHWTLEGATYFLTWRLHPGQAPMSPGERTMVWMRYAGLTLSGTR